MGEVAVTVEEIINGILESEGEGKPPYITKGDRGGRTSWGVSERWHPELWVNGPPTREQAFNLFMREYFGPWQAIPYSSLQAQLTDISILHGLPRAKLLLKETVNGVSFNSVSQWEQRLINNALVAHRLAFIDRLTDEEKSQKKFEEGWESRALTFLVRD